VKHFWHISKAHNFTIFTDNKSITYAFQQKRDKCSLLQFNHLDHIAQFTADIRHISGQDNVVADSVSRVESVTAPPSHEALDASQDSDDECRKILASNTALWLEEQQIPGTTVSIYFDTSARKPRPDVPASLRLKCSSPSTICHILALKQQRNWSQNVSCFQACRRIVAPGHGFAKSASAPKSPATQLLHWGT
jgi:hypothetical protein